MPLTAEDRDRMHNLETAWLKYRDESQAIADDRAAGEDPEANARILEAATAGVAATADETLTFVLHDLPQLAGMEGTGPLNPVATVLGVEDFRPEGLAEDMVYNGVNLITAYAAPGGVAMKIGQAGVKAGKGLAAAGKAGDAGTAATKGAGATPAKGAADLSAEAKRAREDLDLAEQWGDDADVAAARERLAAVQARDGAGDATTGASRAAMEAPTEAPTKPAAPPQGGKVSRTLKSIGREGTQAALGGLVARDPYAERLLLLKQSAPGMREVIEEWEEAQDPEHTRWEGRFANAVEELGLGMAGAAIIPPLYQGAKRAILSLRQGRAERSPALRNAPDGEMAHRASRREALRQAKEIEDRLRQGSEPGAGAGDGLAPGSRQFGGEGVTAATPRAQASAAARSRPAGDAAADTGGAPDLPEMATVGDATEILRLGVMPYSIEGARTLVQRLAGDVGEAVSPYHATRLAAARIHEVAQKAGAGGAGQTELRQLNERLLEWGALQGARGERMRNDLLRRAAVENALVAYRREVVGALDEAQVSKNTPLLTNQEAMALWDDVVGANPLYEPHTPAMVRGRYAARRSVSVAQARSQSLLGHTAGPDGTPVGRGELHSSDRRVWRQNVSLHDGIVMNEAYQPGSSWSAEWVDRPVDVYLADVAEAGDFEALTLAVREAMGAASRAGGEGSARASLNALLTDAAHGTSQGIVDQIAGGASRTPSYVGQEADILDTTMALANTVRSLGRIAAGESSTPEQRLQLIRGAQKLDAYLHWAKGDADKAAKALAGANDSTIESMDEVARRMRRVDTLEKEGDSYARAMAGAIGTRGNVHEVVGLVTRWRKDQRSLWEKARLAGVRYVAKPAREIWVNSVLSSPATHARNIVGNSLLPLLQVPEHFLAASLEGGLKQGAREAMAQIQGLMSGTRDGLKLMALDWRHQMREMAEDVDGMAAISRQIEDMDLSLQHEQFARQIKRDDVVHAKAVGLPEVVVERMERSGGWMAPLARTADVRTRQAVNAPLAALRSEDVFFKTLTYRMEVNRLAARQAHREGLSGDAFHERVRVLKRETTMDDDIGLQAMRQAHINTYTNEMGQLGTMTLEQLNRIPGARYVVPFFRTPWNIAARSLEYVPVLGRYVGRQRKMWAEGGRGKREVIARQAMGVAIGSALMPLALQGKISGGNVHNPDMKWTARKLGRQEYSLQVGDTWIDYRRSGGAIGLSVGMITDATTAIHAAVTQEEMDAGVALFHTAVGITASMLGETWAGDVSGLFDIIATQDAEGAERWLTRTGAGFVPWSALQDDARESISLALGLGRYQETKGRGGLKGTGEPTGEAMWEAWQSLYRKAIGPFRLIGEDARKYPRRDVYGQPVKPAQTGWLSGPLAAGAVFSPMVYMQERTDPLSKELLRMVPQGNLGGITNVPQTFPVTGPRGDVRRLEYTTEQYDYLAQKAGEYFLRYGTRMTTLSEYRNGTDTKRAAMLQEARQRANRRATDMAFQRYSDLRTRRIEAQTVMRAAYTGRP